MSQQQSIKNQKQRRNRTNSEGQRRQGGGGFAKVYTNSGTRGELQTLLNTLPNATPQQLCEMGATTGSAKRRGNGGYSNGGGGGQNMSNREDFDTANNEDAESIRLNSSALRRIDKDFLKLHGTASQVAVYRYNPATKSWDKTDTVGCLFLYERTVSPRYGLVVMNRKNANNFIQSFGSDGQVVLQSPYLLLRSGEELRDDLGDGAQVIHCIWFYDIQDCMSSANILRNMGLKFEGEGGVGGDGGSRGMFGGVGSVMNSGGGGTGVQLAGAGNALFQMLQKESPTPMKTNGRVLTAEELESEMFEEDPDPVIPSTKPASTSVFQQFINLSIKGNEQAELVTATVVSLSPVTISQNQMRTVEQLERQMKEKCPPREINDSTTAIQNELIQTLGLGESNVCKPRTPPVATLLPLAQNMTWKPSREVLLTNVIGKCVDDVDPDDLRKLLEVVDPSDLVCVTVPGPVTEGVEAEPKLIWRMRRRSSSLKENNGSTASTFTTPTGEFVSANGTRCNSQLGPVDLLRQPKPTPLTKEQLQQALIYLVQNDSEFLAQIHDAYSQSVQRGYQQQHQQHF